MQTHHTSTHTAPLSLGHLLTPKSSIQALDQLLADCCKEISDEAKAEAHRNITPFATAVNRGIGQDAALTKLKVDTNQQLWTILNSPTTGPDGAPGKSVFEQATDDCLTQLKAACVGAASPGAAFAPPNPAELEKFLRDTFDRAIEQGVDKAIHEFWAVKQAIIAEPLQKILENLSSEEIDTTEWIAKSKKLGDQWPQIKQEMALFDEYQARHPVVTKNENDWSLDARERVLYGVNGISYVTAAVAAAVNVHGVGGIVAGGVLLANLIYTFAMYQKNDSELASLFEEPFNKAISAKYLQTKMLWAATLSHVLKHSKPLLFGKPQQGNLFSNSQETGLKFIQGQLKSFGELVGAVISHQNSERQNPAVSHSNIVTATSIKNADKIIAAGRKGLSPWLFRCRIGYHVAVQLAAMGAAAGILAFGMGVYGVLSGGL